MHEKKSLDNFSIKSIEELSKNVEIIMKINKP